MGHATDEDAVERRPTRFHFHDDHIWKRRAEFLVQCVRAVGLVYAVAAAFFKRLVLVPSDPPLNRESLRFEPRNERGPRAQALADDGKARYSGGGGSKHECFPDSGT